MRIGISLPAQPDAYPATRALMAAQPTTVINSRLTEAGFEGDFQLLPNTGGVYDDLLAADSGTGSGGEAKVSDFDATKVHIRTRKRGDYIKLTEEGGDIIRALNVARERALLFGPSDMVTVEINTPGGIALPQGILCPLNVELVDLGVGKTIWDATGLTTSTLVAENGTIGASGKYAAYFGPSPSTRYSATLPEFDPIERGQAFVDFVAAHDLALGDILHIQKYANSTFGVFSGRTYYKMGHRTKVVGVEGDRVYVELAFPDAYTWSNTGGSEVLAHKQNTYKGRVGLSVDLSGLSLADNRGIYLSSPQGQAFHDLLARGAGYAGIFIDQGYDIRVHESCEAGTKLRTTFPGSGPVNDYGLIINNCTKVDVFSPKLSANWHAYSLGGGADFGNIQNFRVVLHDADLTNTGTGTPHAADIHGNADECGYVRCIFGSGMSLNGRNPFAIDCKVTGKVGATARLLNMTELHSGKVRLTRCEFYTPNNSGTGSTGGAIFGVVDTGSQGEPEFIFERCTLDMPNEQQPMQLGSAAGASFGYSFYFTGHVNIPQTSYGIARLKNDGGVNGKYCRVPWVEGLTSGKPFVAHATYTATKTEFPAQDIPWADTATAAATFSSGTLTYPNAYPSFHTVRATPSVDTGAGAKARIAWFSKTASTIRGQLATGDGTNLTAAAFDAVIQVR